MKDVWDRIREDPLPKLLYGMGNGGDKMLSVCAAKGIAISGVFASDGFARGNLFHGMPVTSYRVAKETFGRFSVLLSFATGRPEVLENILRIARETTLYVPDLPVAGETLFDGAFYEAHERDLARARALFADDRSREVFDRVIESKLTGDPLPLLCGCTTAEEDYKEIFRTGSYGSCGDFGAYDGDTARELASVCPNLKKIVSVEPDPRTFKRLLKNVEGLPVDAVEGAVWSSGETLSFSSSGGRGAALDGAGKKTSVRGVTVDSLFEDLRADYLKFDVEGAEKEALRGAEKVISRDRPDLLVSVYHRPEDLFALPLFIAERWPFYKLYLRRRAVLPAWDLNLCCVK